MSIFGCVRWVRFNDFLIVLRFKLLMQINIVAYAKSLMYRILQLWLCFHEQLSDCLEV